MQNHFKSIDISEYFYTSAIICLLLVKFYIVSWQFVYGFTFCARCYGTDENHIKYFPELLKYCLSSHFFSVLSLTPLKERENGKGKSW